MTPVPTVLDLSPALSGWDGGAPLGAPVSDAVAELVRGHVEPEADIHAGADYRRMLAAELTLRALRAACSGDVVGEGAA